MNVDHSTVDVDVLVIGSGAAGLTAALAARQAGASRVLVAESEAIIGGSSRLSGGLMMGAGTRYQRTLGIEDSPAALFHDYMTLNQWQVEPANVKRLTDRAGETVEWLADLGVEYYDELVFGGDETVPRVHCPIGRGQAVVDILYRRCRDEGVDFALVQRVDRLLVTDGAVCGAAVGDDDMTAGAVVVTTGGFGMDRAKVQAYFPSLYRTEWFYYIGAEGSRGDAIDFAGAVGAQFVGFDRGLRLVHSNFDLMYEAYLPGWLVLVNQAGRRFCDETAPYGIMDGLMHAQGDVAYAIFDHRTLVDATALGVARYKHAIPGSTKKQSPHWNVDVVEQMVAEGKAHRADSIEELASRIGTPVDHLVATVERINELAELKEDLDYLKAGTFMEPIASAPFYAAEVRAATCAFTAYGLRTDPDARVLAESGRAIPGLYAAGEVTGGIVGPRYVGSGNSYGNCVTFGRIAGSQAARHAA